MHRPIKTSVGIIIIILFAIAAGLCIYFLEGVGQGIIRFKDNTFPPSPCSRDKKQCPDGSYVSRKQPECGFALCPGEDKNCVKEGEKVVAEIGGSVRECCPGLKPFSELGSFDAAICSRENKEIVGDDRDEHGCIGSAGYQWCEEKQKCLRSWEESCD